MTGIFKWVLVPFAGGTSMANKKPLQIAPMPPQRQGITRSLALDLTDSNPHWVPARFKSDQLPKAAPRLLLAIRTHYRIPRLWHHAAIWCFSWPSKRRVTKHWRLLPSQANLDLLRLKNRITNFIEPLHAQSADKNYAWRFLQKPICKFYSKFSKKTPILNCLFNKPMMPLILTKWQNNN